MINSCLKKKNGFLVRIIRSLYIHILENFRIMRRMMLKRIKDILEIYLNIITDRFHVDKVKI